MNFNPGSMGCVMPPGDPELNDTLAQEYKYIWAGNATQMDEGEVEEERDHVTAAGNLPVSKYGRRSMEHLRTKVARQLFNLERVLAAKKQYSAASLISIFRYDGSYVALPYPPPLSVLRLNQETRHIIDTLEKQRKLELSRLQGFAISTRSQDRTSSSTPCLNMGLIYHRLYLNFLARRILKRSPTIFNRRTIITVCESAIIEEEEDGPNAEWISESREEKFQRNLRASGIRIAHTARKWNSIQPKHACFQPSLLRWNWTVDEDGESEAFPVTA